MIPNEKIKAARLLKAKKEGEEIVIDTNLLNEIIKKYPKLKEAIEEQVEEGGKKFNLDKKLFRKMKGIVSLGEIEEVLTFKQYKEIPSHVDEKLNLKPKAPELSEEEIREILSEAHGLIINVLKKYCDLEEEYYSLISLWILGTYIHNSFPTFPYLYFNAMRGSGKTRILHLIAHLSREGEVINSLTEAVLFRENNCICIDEFEGASRKGNENLLELLNVAYKKGGIVKRMKKVKSFEGETQKVEKFDVYRPVIMANINGMDNVLGDRCLKLIIQRSVDARITKRMELFDEDSEIAYIKKLLNPFERVGLCRVYAFVGAYKGWNKFIDNGFKMDDEQYNVEDTTSKLTGYTQLYTTIHNSNLLGRDLELSFPILILSYFINEEVYTKTLVSLIDIMGQKKEDDVIENKDVSLLDFLSQEYVKDENKMISLKELTIKFKAFMQTEEDWLTPQWVGYSLKRLSLITKKERKGYGVCAIINYKKAREKISQYK